MNRQIRTVFTRGATRVLLVRAAFFISILEGRYFFFNTAIASSLGTEMRTDILKRRKRTRTQTRLNVEEKARNVAGAFEVTGKACDTFRSRTDIRHVLIVDDVFTTGSTLMACFTALRTVFPPSVRISVATLGFVGGG